MKRLLGLALAGMMLVTASGCSDKAASTQGSPPANTASAATTIEAFGVVHSARVRNIVLEFPARVEEVLVKEGQRVRKGDALMRLNLEDINGHIAIKEHELTLAKNEGIKARIAIVEEELTNLKARRDRPFLKENTLVSDADESIVSDIGFVAGDIAGPGVRVVKLSALQERLVQADVLEEFIKDVAVGAQVTMRPTADKTREYTGKVAAIGNMAVKSRTGETTILVEITLDKADEFLLPGFNVELKIQK